MTGWPLPIAYSTSCRCLEVIIKVCSTLNSLLRGPLCNISLQTTVDHFQLSLLMTAQDATTGAASRSTKPLSDKTEAATAAPAAFTPIPAQQMGPAATAPADGGAAVEGAPDSVVAVSVVAVPVVEGQISSLDVVPALQQLLSIFQVEYWALLEELRAQHHELCPSAGTAAGTTPAGAAAGRDAAAGSMRQLWQSAQATSSSQQPNGASGGAQPPQTADHTSTQQQQQRGSPPALQSPFAAAAQPYGDQRCGFADPHQDHQQPQQQQQQPQQQQQQQQALNIPSLQQAEQLLQQLAAAGQQGAGIAGAEQLQEWRQRWAAVAPSVAGLEQLASAVSMQYMDAQGGLACLCGQHGRWVVRRTAAVIGRCTDGKGDVDVDLGKAAGEAGLGSKVSRLQAQLLLTADGCWSITNTGRAPLAVNGHQVPRGSTVTLPHLSLLDVAGLPLLFMVNSMAVQRAVARSAHLAL